MSDVILNYRTLRQKTSLAARDGAMLSALREVEWNSAEPKRKELKRSLLIEGAVTGKGPASAVSWRFPVSDQDFKALDDAWEEFREAVKAWKTNPLDAPLEKELWADVFPWLRLGFVSKGAGKSHGYFEFTRDGAKLRTVVPDLAAMDQLRRILMG